MSERFQGRRPTLRSTLSTVNDLDTTEKARKPGIDHRRGGNGWWKAVVFRWFSLAVLGAWNIRSSDRGWAGLRGRPMPAALGSEMLRPSWHLPWPSREGVGGVGRRERQGMGRGVLLGWEGLVS